MKFITAIILTALLSFAVCLYLPWWTIALVAFLVTIVLNLRPGKAFLAGFIALFFLWAVISFTISHANGHLLAHKVSVIILKTDDPAYLILATALIGALVAGFAALAGSFVRSKDTLAS